MIEINVDFTSKNISFNGMHDAMRGHGKKSFAQDCLVDFFKDYEDIKSIDKIIKLLREDFHKEIASFLSIHISVDGKEYVLSHKFELK